MVWLKYLINPLTSMFGKWQENKQTRKTLEAKLKLAKHTKDEQLALTEKEWELWSKKNENESWKDEYVTLIVTCPIPFVFIAAIISDAWLERVMKGVDAINELLPNYHEMVVVVIAAAIGIRALKK